VDPDSMTLWIPNPDPWARKMRTTKKHFFDIYILIFRTLKKKLSSNFPLWIRIRIGSGFKNFVDPDPDWGKIPDPD
jgi:hypothetical protein